LGKTKRFFIIQKEEIETNIFKENLKGNKGKNKKI